MKKPFNLQRFASNKIPATKASILVDDLRNTYVSKIIKNKKIDKNLYIDLNKKNLYVIAELNSMFNHSRYKNLSMMVHLLQSSMPIQNIPVGIIIDYLLHNPMALLEAIGNAYSYKNFTHPDRFTAPYTNNIGTKNKTDFKNILEILPLDWINLLLLKGTNIIEVVKIMCEINFDFSKVNKESIRALRLNKRILNSIGDCPNIKGFLASKK